MSNTEQDIETKNKEIQEEKEKFFIDENEQKRIEFLTPSGRFKILIRYYSTKEGCWNYSRGTVYDLEGDEICDIKRNYSSFDHSFVVKDGQEWLITGRSYMSQTIINLDEAQIYEPSGDHYDDYAFCWAGEVLSPDGKILLVDGCHWACPYQYRFFDFSDPAKGWPEIEIYKDGEPFWLDSDGHKHPDFNDDGTITCYQTSRFYLPLNKYEEDLNYEKEIKPQREAGEYSKKENYRIDIDKKITLRKEGNQMIVTDHWLSEVEQDRIERRRIADEKYKKWEKEFKSTDPLYLEYLEQLKNPILNPEKHASRGVTHKNWCPDFKEQETRWCRRIINRDDKQPYTIDLEWAVTTGPIKLQIYKDGNKYEDKFFEHSAEEMKNAFLYAQSLIT